jgi:hypothetical protein
VSFALLGDLLEAQSRPLSHGSRTPRWPRHPHGTAAERRSHGLDVGARPGAPDPPPLPPARRPPPLVSKCTYLLSLGAYCGAPWGWTVFPAIAEQDRAGPLLECSNIYSHPVTALSTTATTEGHSSCHHCHTPVGGDGGSWLKTQFSASPGEDRPAAPLAVLAPSHIGEGRPRRVARQRE